MQVTEVIKNYSLIMKKISETKIAGVIPLDLLLHAIIGYLIYIFLKKVIKVNSVTALFFVFLIELAKEVLDSFSLTNTLLENIIDIAATMTIPVILVLIDKINKPKQKLN